MEVIIEKVEQETSKAGKPYKFQPIGYVNRDGDSMPDGKERHFVFDGDKPLPVGRFRIMLEKCVFYSTRRRRVELRLREDALVSLSGTRTTAKVA